MHHKILQCLFYIKIHLKERKFSEIKYERLNLKYKINSDRDSMLQNSLLRGSRSNGASAAGEIVAIPLDSLAVGTGNSIRVLKSLLGAHSMSPNICKDPYTFGII